MDIRGLGPETVDALVSSGLVHSVADLFSLRTGDLVKLERFADVSAAHLVRAIDTARHTTLWRFLNGLGIPHAGAQTAGDLAAQFGSLGAIRAASEAEIRSVPGIGPVVARDVADFFQQRANRRVIDLCLRRGVALTGAQRRGRGPLAGKVIVFTGGLDSMTREEAEDRAHACGARTARSVGPHTDLVVAGREPGSKWDRARALGVRIVDEGTFRKMAAGRT